MRNQVGWTWLVVAMQPSGAIDNLGARAWWIQTSLGPGQWLLLRQSSTHHFWPKGKAVLAERLGLTITLGWMKKWRADVIPYTATIWWLIDISCVFCPQTCCNVWPSINPKKSQSQLWYWMFRTLDLMMCYIICICWPTKIANIPSTNCMMIYRV